jgi:hypothetical protein
MTTAGHPHRRRHSKLVHEADAIAIDEAAEKRNIVARDLAFQGELAAAIQRGDESLEAVLGERKPRVRTPPAPADAEFWASLDRRGGLFRRVI